MNGRRRQLGIAMRCVGAGVMVVCAAMAHAEERKEPACKEEDRADAKLTAIVDDDKWRKELLELHLPFGVHIGTHAPQGAPTNEKLLVQATILLVGVFITAAIVSARVF